MTAFEERAAFDWTQIEIDKELYVGPLNLREKPVFFL